MSGHVNPTHKEERKEKTLKPKSLGAKLAT
jgi:hypothetical protein